MIKTEKQLLRQFNHIPYPKSIHEVKLSTFKKWSNTRDSKLNRRPTDATMEIWQDGKFFVLALEFYNWIFFKSYKQLNINSVIIIKILIVWIWSKKYKTKENCDRRMLTGFCWCYHFGYVLWVLFAFILLYCFFLGILI